jgi:hypothetical protein
MYQRIFSSRFINRPDNIPYSSQCSRSFVPRREFPVVFSSSVFATKRYAAPLTHVEVKLHYELFRFSNMFSKLLIVPFYFPKTEA